ncbi:MAG: hypothetical protein JWN24_2871 [Phycisphaerales bacterium]|nr:hypothetical protein [Phycisphaerales bacterium]
MRALAGPFLSRDTFHHRIGEWKRLLTNFRLNPGSGKMSWQVPEDRPFETIESAGEYEPHGRKGEFRVIGRLSGAWDILADPPQQNTPAKCFTLSGHASFKLSVWALGAEGSRLEVARWSSDIGDHASPGCHFHSQIDLDEKHGVFPKGLSVPRLPGLLLTPMDLLEYLIAELFQAKWMARASKGSQEVRNWSNAQRPRLLRMLSWQHQAIRRAGGSPWTTLKRAKPHMTMLLEDVK